MARFYPPGGGSSGSGGSSIDLDQITVPKRLVADGYKTITSDSIGEIVSGLLPKLDNASFGDTFDTSKIISATSDNTNGSFNFVLDGYFDDTEDNKSTTVTIPNCIPANIVSGIKVGGSNGYLTGTYTSDATATAEDICLGKTAYVNGEKIEGNAVLADMLLYKPLQFVFAPDLINEYSQTSELDIRATKFVYTNTAPSDNITFENNGLCDLTLFNTKSILSWYEIDGDECIQYIWSRSGKIFVFDAMSMFKDYQKCVSIDLSMFDFKYIRSSYWMFSNCSSLTSIDLSNFDTSKVTDMSNMFSGCASLTLIEGISNFDTSNVTDMGWMFGECSLLTSLDLSNWNTSNVTNMSSMFQLCSSLTSLDLSNFDTSKVTDMGWMFYNCTSLMQITFSDKFVLSDELYQQATYNTYNNNLYAMYQNCPANKPTGGNWDSGIWTEDTGTFLKAVILTTADEINRKINVNATSFAKAVLAPSDNIITESLSHDGDDSIITWYDESTITQYWYSNVQRIIMPSNCDYMFSDRTLLTYIDLSGWDSSKVTSMTGIFATCSSLTSLDLSEWNTSNVTSMSYMFSSCSSLTSLDLSSFDTSNVTDMNQMFYRCSSLTLLDVSNFNTSKVTSMRYLFNGCNSLTLLDISHWDTSKVTDMNSMFYNCSKLTSLDVSRWNTSSTINMNVMFCNCSGLTSLDVSHFDTSNVTSMSSMFHNCIGLTLLDVSNFNTSKVTTMSSMFSNCNSLTSLDVSNFNTSKVTDMDTMFYNCSKLTSLDLSSFDTSNVTNMSYMFKYCSKITNITYGSNFIIPDAVYNTCMLDNNDNRTYNMYGGCTVNKPIGGNWDLGSWNNSGTFVINGYLTAGSNINTAINNSAMSFTRSVSAPPDGTTLTDISRDGDGSIVTWYDTSTTTQYWYSECMILSMNPDSSGLFEGLTKATSINISDWYTHKVENMSMMFSKCQSLTSLDLSNFDTCSTTTLAGMFIQCTSLTTIIYSDKFILTSAIKDGSDSGMWGTTKGMFDYCPANKPTGGDWDLGTWVEQGSGIGGTAGYFSPASMIITGSVFNTIINKSATSLVNLRRAPDASIITTDISKDGDGSIVTWYDDTDNIQYWYSKYSHIYANPDSSNMFRNCNNMDQIYFEFDTSKVTNMSYMCSGCTNATTLDTSMCDTSNVTDMSYMFSGCTNATTISLIGADTSNVINMRGMFERCISLSKNMWVITLSDTVLNNCTSVDEANPTYHMYNECPVNKKPTGGNWDLGSWTADGTFIKN